MLTSAHLHDNLCSYFMQLIYGLKKKTKNISPWCHYLFYVHCLIKKRLRSFVKLCTFIWTNRCRYSAKLREQFSCISPWQMVHSISLMPQQHQSNIPAVFINLGAGRF